MTENTRDYHLWVKHTVKKNISPKRSCDCDGVSAETQINMASLQLATKARHASYINPVPVLYRAIAKELPRVLTIYDIDIPVHEARAGIRSLFQANQHIRDTRVLDMLVEKGYMELEETLLHYKQRPHLLRIFEGFKHTATGADRKKLGMESTIDEQFARA